MILVENFPAVFQKKLQRHEKSFLKMKRWFSQNRILFTFCDFVSLNEPSLENMQIFDSYCSSSFESFPAFLVLSFAGFSYAPDSCYKT